MLIVHTGLQHTSGLQMPSLSLLEEGRLLAGVCNTSIHMASIYWVGDTHRALRTCGERTDMVERCITQPLRICPGSDVSSGKESYPFERVNSLFSPYGVPGTAQAGSARVNAYSDTGRLLMKGPM